MFFYSRKHFLNHKSQTNHGEKNDAKEIAFKSKAGSPIELKLKEKLFGTILLFAGAFAVSYLVMPGSFARSGIILATVTLIYSGFINYTSTGLILDVCRKNRIRSYYQYYTFVLGPFFGNLVFCIFFLNAFIITVSTLVSLNVLLSDFMSMFTSYPFLIQPHFCFWALAITLLTTPFIYKNTDESMVLITILTGSAIFLSLFVVLYMFYLRFNIIDETPVKYFDFRGSVFSFDISYFSFIVQLNIFDLFLMFKGSLDTKFRKIHKVSFITNFVIFVPYFIMGNSSHFDPELIPRLRRISRFQGRAPNPIQVLHPIFGQRVRLDHDREYQHDPADHRFEYLQHHAQ